ncbi:DUF1798 family protein [Staphylococcus ratti]|uniref:DUF1798 family protein n=1 Tax=Staphylococcus ratti TaxID=2892440 RepID=A0ABY3PA30_9STAP|nr:DUF1798 family protein [Staphylococcus ratti]UEX89165.1 DUF1798 family protein [Staphylococcus ratti]
MIEQLILINEQIQNRFILAKRGQSFQFDTEIKPFINDVDVIISKFKTYQAKIIQLPYFNEQKFHQLIKLIEETSIECHYATTSTKIFNEKEKVITHDLNYIKQMSESKHV